jgi:hypothetical protein
VVAVRTVGPAPNFSRTSPRPGSRTSQRCRGVRVGSSSEAGKLAAASNALLDDIPSNEALRERIPTRPTTTTNSKPTRDMGAWFASG